MFPDRFVRWAAAAIAGGMFCATVAPSSAAALAVPKTMIGTWAHGNCASQKDRLVITSTTAALGTDEPKPVVYFTNDAGPGKGALHWREEGNVDNFVYLSAERTIVHNTQGYNMPGRVYYGRCRNR